VRGRVGDVGAPAVHGGGPRPKAEQEASGAVDAAPGIGRGAEVRCEDDGVDRGDLGVGGGNPPAGGEDPGSQAPAEQAQGCAVWRAAVELPAAEGPGGE
jgi:hypothetical protein